MRATDGNLKKLEALFTSQGYKVRYEKGNFNSGACTVHKNNVVVVNKFVTLEVKINTLVELWLQTDINRELIPKEYTAFYESLNQTHIKV